MRRRAADPWLGTGFVADRACRGPGPLTHRITLEGITMPHTYSLQNVPSHVAAGEAHYHHLLAGSAEARRFVTERTYKSASTRRVGAVLRRATSVVLMRLGVWLQGETVLEAA